MGNLPSQRVQPKKAFLNTSVDYAGPLYIRPGSRHRKIRIKGYIEVFVHLAMRALHLELMSEITSEALMATLHRFIFHRGKCANIFSNNRSNFIGASKELHELFQILKRESNTISDSLIVESCQWHFIPLCSPHFGGNRSLTFEEMSTLLTQIKACLNSRPLSKLSDDPTDSSYPTPGHFPIGEPLTSLPEADLSDMSVNRLNRWQQIQQFMQQLCHKWSTDYLMALQQCSKWAERTTSNAAQWS